VTYVVLAADAGYLEYVHCLLGQLAVHGPSCEGVILVVPADLDDERLRDVERTGTRVGLAVEVVELPGVEGLMPAGAIRGRDHVSAFTFSTLLLPTALPGLDQVVYLDIDVLVRDSIEELLGWRLTHPIGAVRELGDGAVHLFGSTRVPYFNAGVLRMSLARMREMDVLGAAREILRERPRLPFHDQDVLNLIFRDCHDALPLAFNVFEPVASAGLPAWQLLTDPAIVHFVGPDKPWQEAYRSRFTREWRAAQGRALSLSPELANRYAQPGTYEPVGSVAGAIARARGTAVGRGIRSVLPDPVKAWARSGLLRLLPRRSRVRRDVRTGLLADARGAELGGSAPSDTRG
jgi:lipopolysaccharide biosynthesis glycosyltransferase